MLNEGFKRKCEGMDSEIRKLHKEIDLKKEENNSVGAQLFDMVGTGAMLTAPGPIGKAVGAGIKHYSTTMK